jgi:hypothetical protein
MTRGGEDDGTVDQFGLPVQLSIGGAGEVHELGECVAQLASSFELWGLDDDGRPRSDGLPPQWSRPRTSLPSAGFCTWWVKRDMGSVSTASSSFDGMVLPEELAEEGRRNSNNRLGKPEKDGRDTDSTQGHHDGSAVSRLGSCRISWTASGEATRNVSRWPSISSITALSGS